MSKPKGLIYMSEKRSAYLGPPFRYFERDYIASTVLLALNGHMDVFDKNNKHKLSTRSLLIPANSRIKISSHCTLIAVIHLEDISFDLKKLSPAFSQIIEVNGATVFSGIQFEEKILTHANHGWEYRPNAEESFSFINYWVNKVCSKLSIYPDKRISNAVKLINQNLMHNTPVENIANKVHLSTPHITHLFKQTVGTNIRRYRQWRRILFSIKEMAQDESLTEISFKSGFCDYSQYHRTFKNFLAITPGKFRNAFDISVIEGHFTTMDQTPQTIKTSDAVA